jgi:hypothetical protein
MYVSLAALWLLASSAVATPQETQRSRPRAVPRTSQRAAQGGPTVHITVTTNASAAITNAYVALVPRDAPMRRPLREAITPSGIVDLTVPPGSYLLTAGADGFETDYRKLVVIRRQPEPLWVSLSPEFRVNGTVKDADGKPIPNARVSQAAAVPPPPVGTLSAAAMKAFGARLHTTTDAKGAWELVVSTSRKTSLLVEAPGYAPAWVLYDPAGEKRRQLEVALQKGSSLRATLDRAEADAVISVAPKLKAGQTLPPIAQSLVWGREATGTTVAWDSLPPGEYRIFALYPDPTRFAAPVDVGSVTLTAGASAEVRVKLPPTPQRQSSFVRFFVSDENGSLPALHAYAKKSGGGAQEARYSVEDTSGGKVVYVAGTSSPADAYLTTATELITVVPRRPAPNRQGITAQHTVRVPRGDGRLHVTAAEGVALPSSAIQSLHDCEKGETFTLPANVSAQGTLDLPLAVPCKALTLQFESFAPLTLVASVEQGEKKFLGDHALLPSSIAEIHVVRDKSNSDAAQAVVQATVRRGSDVKPITVAEATANDEGRVVMKNVPAGEEVTFQARDAKTRLVGTATARIEAGKRAVIDPLLIPEYASLAVAPELDSEFQSAYPEARILGVTVVRDNAQPSDRKTVNFDQDKTEALFQDIVPGRWAMTVLVNVDGSKEMLDLDAVTVESGEDERVTPKVKPLAVSGQVLSHGEGVAASLSVGDPPGPNAIRRRVFTEPNGTFKVIVPRSATYHVQAQRTGTRTAAVDLGPILFDGSPLRIDLPEGTLRVNVKRGNVPLAKALVVAVSRVDNPDGSGVSSVTRRVKTDDAGLALFEGLSSGVWTVQASAPDGDGVAQKDATIAASAPIDVTLEIDDSNVLAGNVLDANAKPAAAASVECAFPTGMSLQSASAETGADGSFVIHLPNPAPPSLQCGVTTTDGAIGAFRSKVTRTAAFTMPPSGGALTIADWGQRVIPDRFWLVGSDGTLFNLSWAARKVGRIGAPLAISRLPAGRWTVVEVHSIAQLLALGQGNARAVPRVAEVTVQPGQSMTINIQDVTTVANK